MAGGRSAMIVPTAISSFIANLRSAPLYQSHRPRFSNGTHAVEFRSMGQPRAAVPTCLFNLRGRDQIELARGFCIEQGAFFLIAAAPVFMPAGDAKEVARAYALLAGFVLVEIGTLDAYDPYIGGMGVPASIASGDEFRVRASRAGVWVSPKPRGANTCSAATRRFSEGRVIRISEGDLVALRLKASDGPCRDEPQSDCKHPQ